MIKLKLTKINKLHKIIRLSNNYKKNTYTTFIFGNINLFYYTIYFKYYAILLLNKQGITMTKGLMRTFLKILKTTYRRDGRVGLLHLI